MTRTIRGLLWGTASLLAVALFVFVFATMYFVQERSIRKDAFQDAEVLARVTFSSMFQLMSTGWTRRQLEEYIGALDTAVAGSPARIRIYRGDSVSALFGQIEQSAPDGAVAEALLHGAPSRHFGNDAARFIFPLAAEARCLKCHQNATIGTVLGAIEVSQSVGSIISENRESLFLAYLVTIPISFLAILLVVGSITKRLDRSIAQLGREINAVNRVADLRKLADRKTDLGFAEFDRIGNGIRQLTERLRGVAIDRDVLELEIRLLERFVITSEIVRDWRDQISRLLIEIDTVMPSYALFSVFRSGDADYELEVFWRYSPDDEVRARIEAQLRASVAHSTRSNDRALVVYHTVADASRQLNPAAAAAMDVQTKSLILPVPRIGGIVGIGLQAGPVDEPSRLLAIEAVLSTLLNVVGSIKAIHRYAGELEYHATRDPLTSLFNQRVFWELLETEFARAKRRDHPVGLLLIDLDHFKSINDGYGHAFGDVYLKTLAATLREALRAEDILARYGGDEFVALLPASTEEETVRVAHRILDAISATVITTRDGSDLVGSASIGMATYPQHAESPHDLFLLADSMMYRAKSEGRNRMAMPGADDLAGQFRSASENTLRILRAADHQRIEPFIQPIVDTITNKVVAVEVLSRLRDEQGRLIGADEFVPAAEKLGVMHRIDLIVMRKALEALRNDGFDGLILVNTSPRSLVMETFVQQVTAIVSRTGISPSRIVFEITEREALHDSARFDAFVAEIKAPGFKLALDDFGSGFSTYQYLKRFPVDFLKIEGEFILNMMQSTTDFSMVTSMVSLAHELGIRCIAEHVEDAEIYGKVVSMGIDFAQGYYIGPPRPPEEGACVTQPGFTPLATL